MKALPLRWNPLMRDMTRPIGVSLMVANFVLGLLGAFFARNGGNALPWIAAMVWLGPGVHLMLLAWRGRSLGWELALPLTARDLWRRHLVAMTASGLLVWLVTAALIWLLMGVVTLFRVAWPYPPLHILGACLLGGVGLVPLAAWAHVRRPEIRTVSVPVWLDLVVMTMILAIVVVGMNHPIPAVLLLGLMTIIAIRWGSASLPSAWSEVVEARRSAVDAKDPGSVTAKRRFSDWRILAMIYRSTPRGVLVVAFMIPLTLFFGLLMGGGAERLLAGSELKLLFLPITAYVMLVSGSFPLAGLKAVDAFPLGRDRILMMLLVPYLAAWAVGYAGGAIWNGMEAHEEEQILFVNTEDRYGLLVPLMLFDVAAEGETPVVEAPWGERHDMMTVPVFGMDDESSGGPVLWKPYTVPRGASKEFAGWQLARALEDLHGKNYDPVELTERYFVVNPDGLVEARGGELTFAADHPGLRNRSRVSLLPVILGVLGVLWLPPFAAYLSVCRVRHSKGRRKTVLWSQMGVLLLLHIVSFMAPLIGLFRPDRVEIAAAAWMSHLVKTLPGGAVLFWIPTLIILATGWWLVVHRFRAHEAGHAVWWGCLLAPTGEGRS